MELVSFLKVLHSFTADVKKIDDETTTLLNETILAIEVLKSASKKCEILADEKKSWIEDQFRRNLNAGIIQRRRYIKCCLCEVN